MLTAAAFVPSPPLLVPQLAGAAASETDRLRRAALDVAGRLADSCVEWTAIGVAEVGRGPADVAPESCGTFRGFGVDLPVSLSDAPPTAPDPDMPLAALVAGWLRGRAAPSVRVRVRTLAADTPAAECTQLGARLRAEFDESTTAQGLLVIADGANTLTDKAPGAFDERSADVEAALDRALAAGDPAALAALDPELCAAVGLAGRAAWQVLSGVFGDVTGTGKPRKAESSYNGAPYGVGYHVGMWLP
ncbi:hypothetical protein GS507_01060 [Rhodococcus hoagii]|nr:hypothetical protein [Prescottella equi]